MDRISTLIESLEDFKLRSEARIELSRMDPELVCPQLMEYLQREHANVNGIWAALNILKQFRWMPVLDLWDYLCEPDIVPAIPVDTGEKGKPSDHSGVICYPIGERRKTKEFRFVRPFPRSKVEEFGKHIRGLLHSVKTAPRVLF